METLGIPLPSRLEGTAGSIWVLVDLTVLVATDVVNRARVPNGNSSIRLVATTTTGSAVATRVSLPGTPQNQPIQRTATGVATTSVKV